MLVRVIFVSDNAAKPDRCAEDEERSDDSKGSRADRRSSARAKRSGRKEPRGDAEKGDDQACLRLSILLGSANRGTRLAALSVFVYRHEVTRLRNLPNDRVPARTRLPWCKKAAPLSHSSHKSHSSYSPHQALSTKH